MQIEAMIDDEETAKEIQARTAFQLLRLRPPYLREAQKTIDRVRMAGQDLIGKQQPIVAIVGPSQAGKSTIVKDYKERIAAKNSLPPGWHPVVSVTLGSSATRRTLGIDIINALGDYALPPEVVASSAG